MRDYVVTGRQAGFGPGDVLALDQDQIDRRVRALVPADAAALAVADSRALGGRGAVQVVRPVQFKYGETVGVIAAGSLNKAALAALAPDGSPPAAAAQHAARNAKRQADEKAAAAGRAHRDAEALRRQRKAEPKKLPAGKKAAASKPAGLAGDETAAAAAAGRGAMQQVGAVRTRDD